MSFELAAGLIGGIGLFLLGMRLMTDGLRVAAGSALRNILANWTGTRLRGIGSGLLVTSLVQSSSAVTVATIGFVNAGLLTLGQALLVTYGSNIGTTMTGWLVVLIGFEVNVRAFALPLIGIGMALRIGSRSGRLGPLGEALAGFGIFFLGIDTLKLAFAGLSGQIEIGALVGAGPWRVILLVLTGFALTLLMQSSSAAIAIILTAAGGGIVPIGSGAALVIGANIGTTSTAGLAVIGATANAKRVAAGHVAFNLLSGVVALILLPVLLSGIVRGRELMDLQAEPAAVLAGFHTIFNLLGVALMLPLTNRLQRLLEGRFRTAEEDEATPRYLDSNVLQTPRLAFDALFLELTRVGQLTRGLAASSLEEPPVTPRVVAAGRRSLDALVDAVGSFAQRLQRTKLSPELDPLLPTTLRVSRYYAEVAELAGLIAAGRSDAEPIADDGLREVVRELVADARRLVEKAGVEEEGYGIPELDADLTRFQDRYQQVKTELLDAGSRGVLTVHDLVSTLDWLSNVRRLAEQIERATRHLASLSLGGDEPAEDEAAEDEAESRAAAS